MRRVIKLGGSLFDLPGLAAKLHAWLNQQAPAEVLLIAGGGGFVDCLRRIDQLQGLSAEDAHWLAIEAMSPAAKLLSRLTSIPVATAFNLPRDSRHAILDIAACLAADAHLRAQFRSELPADWQTTSDSIAAFIAYHWLADELVLLKSTLSAHAWSSRELAAAGIVDGYFPLAAAGLQSIRLVDFRSSDAAEIRISQACGA